MINGKKLTILFARFVTIAVFNALNLTLNLAYFVLMIQVLIEKFKFLFKINAYVILAGTMIKKIYFANLVINHVNLV